MLDAPKSVKRTRSVHLHNGGNRQYAYIYATGTEARARLVACVRGRLGFRDERGDLLLQHGIGEQEDEVLVTYRGGTPGPTHDATRPPGPQICAGNMIRRCAYPRKTRYIGSRVCTRRRNNHSRLDQQGSQSFQSALPPQIRSNMHLNTWLTGSTSALTVQRPTVGDTAELP